ncbi:uncharacterized protein [Cherax quadricarinatus]
MGNSEEMKKKAVKRARVESCGGCIPGEGNDGDVLVKDGGDVLVKDAGDVLVKDGGDVLVKDGGDVLVKDEATHGVLVKDGGDVLVKDEATHGGTSVGESVEAVVEAPWVGGSTREVEVGSTPPQATITDLTQHFQSIFDRTTFRSFKEFEDLFNQFKKETGSVFRIKSSCSVAYENSRRKKHFIPAHFKFVSVRYCCVHYGQPKIAGQGIRMKQRYLPCGCECFLYVSYNRGALVISQAAMQHNHEVSNQMAPYYAINRRISNEELRQVADVIELIPSSRALQHFLQEHFHRPTTLQDAKNVRARLKTLQLNRAANSGAVRSFQSETVMQEMKEENSSEDSIKTSVENLSEEIYMDNFHDENQQEEQEQQEQQQQEQQQQQQKHQLQQQQQQQTYVHHQLGQDQLLQPKCKEKVISEIKAKLSDLMHFCETDVFWERISVINKIIECWENGDHFDIHYASENIYSSDDHTVIKQESVLHERGHSSSQPQRKVLSQGRLEKTPLVKLPSSIVNNSDSALRGFNMQLLPTPCDGEALKLVFSQDKNKIHNTSATVQKRHPGRPRKNYFKFPLKQREELSELSSVMELSEKSNLVKTPSCSENIEQNRVRTSMTYAKQPIVMSVTKDNSSDMCDQAMEIEIEINGDAVNVKRVKMDPLESYEVDVTDNIH